MNGRDAQGGLLDSVDPETEVLQDCFSLDSVYFDSGDFDPEVSMKLINARGQHQRILYISNPQYGPIHPIHVS